MKLFIHTNDLIMLLGQSVKIALHRPLNGQNVWTGFIDGVDEENIMIHTEKEECLRIGRKDIAWAKLEVEI